jgi:threonine dehydratase
VPPDSSSRSIDLLSAADIQDAAARLRPFLPPTPLRRSFALRRHGEVWLKLECWQPTGSYKVRGALHYFSRLSPADRSRGVVAASAGNHALGLAFAAARTRTQAPLVVCVPETAPQAKLERLAEFAVDLRRVGRTYDDAQREAVRLAAATGARLADAVEDPVLAAGHGTLGLELLEERPEIRAVVVPVGGGALITGIATAIKTRRPDVRVIAAQSEAYPAMRDSLAAGRALTELPQRPTLADGLAGGIGEMVFAHRQRIDGVVTVSEDDIGRAMVTLLGDEHVVAEGAGAVAAAAILSGKLRVEGPTAVVVSGGNVDAALLRRLLRDAP